MVVACLVATTTTWNKNYASLPSFADSVVEIYDSIDGPSEEEAYLQGKHSYDDSLLRYTHRIITGEYKTILQLVAVLSQGKIAKRLTDHAIDHMQDVQNLRKAIYEYVQSPFLKHIYLKYMATATSSRSTRARRGVPSSRNCSTSASTTCRLRQIISLDS